MDSKATSPDGQGIITQKEPEPQKGPTSDIPHGILLWIACYDDSCATHRSDKEGSGWFPRKPKSKRRANKGQEPSNMVATMPTNEDIQEGFTNAQSERIGGGYEIIYYHPLCTIIHTTQWALKKGEHGVSVEVYAPGHQAVVGIGVALRGCRDPACAHFGELHTHDVLGPCYYRLPPLEKESL